MNLYKKRILSVLQCETVFRIMKQKDKLYVYSGGMVMSKKVVTMGEILLRLSTPGYERFYQSKSFDVAYGGAEINVAVSLANFGLDSYFVTKLPDNSIGESAEGYLRQYGVKTDYIAKGDGRLGIYFFEKGISERPSKVIYDRHNSTITEAEIDDFDFDEIFRDADWFHFSGIIPALGDKCIKICEKAVESAKKYNVPISLDLNYRKKLWTVEEFERVMPRFLEKADVCIGWLSSIEEERGKDEIADFAKAAVNMDKFRIIFDRMQKKFNLKYVVTTLRENYSASHNALSAIIYDGEKLYKANKYDFTIQDRVGAGDAFAAGLIYKLVMGASCEEALEFGVAASVLKHTIGGDFNLESVEEVVDISTKNYLDY